MMSIHQQAVIPASPDEVYAVLAGAGALSGMSGRGAAPRAESFPPTTGMSAGWQIELVPGQRIVQARGKY